MWHAELERLRDRSLFIELISVLFDDDDSLDDHQRSQVLQELTYSIMSSPSAP